MSEKGLSEKEWIVLKYFIENESQTIQKWLSTKKRKSESQQHFITYPSKIESDLGNITRPTAGKACNKFLEMGLFNSKKKRPNFKGGETDHYYLKSDLQIIRKLVQLIMEMDDSYEIIQIIGNHYFMYNINESLVKEVLYEKQVQISRRLSFFEWNIKEAKMIFDDYVKLFNKETNDSKITFDKEVRRTINDFEEEHNDCEKIELKRFYNFYKNFFKNSDDDFDVVKHYVTDKFRDSNNLLLSDNITTAMNRLSFSIDLLVFNKNISNEHILEIKKLNADLFEKIPNLQNCHSGFENHYKQFQYKNLILPLLSIIQASPKALNEFINGNWDSFNVNFDFNNNMECEFISKLSLIAIKDILNTFQVPKNSIVESAYSGKLPPNAPSSEYITESLILSLKHLYEISLNLKFIISSDHAVDSSIEVINSVNISPKVSFYLLTVNDIIDAKNLIIKLKDEDDPLYAHIRSKLSNPMQNLILYYDTEITPSVEFQKTIVDDLNYALLRGDLYAENIFSNIISSKEIDEILIKNVDSFNKDDFFKSDIISMVFERDKYYLIRIIEEGRYLLEKAFPEEIYQNYSLYS